MSMLEDSESLGSNEDDNNSKVIGDDKGKDEEEEDKEIEEDEKGKEDEEDDDEDVEMDDDELRAFNAGLISSV